MSHTTIGFTEGVTFIHNGDFSGNLEIIINELPDIGFRYRKADVEQDTDANGKPYWTVSIPFEDIKHIVAEYLRRERIEKLEYMKTDEILGIES